VTWINLNEGTAKPLSDSEAALRAKPLGIAGFPAPQRCISYIAPQTAWLRGTMGASEEEKRQTRLGTLGQDPTHIFVKKTTFYAF
jgi:hypothetical protein